MLKVSVQIKLVKMLGFKFLIINRKQRSPLFSRFNQQFDLILSFFITKQIDWHFKLMRVINKIRILCNLQRGFKLFKIYRN